MEKGNEQKMCFDFLYKFCLKYFSFQEEFKQDIVTNGHRSSRKIAVCLVIF